jgi:hypothetical protein
MESKGCFGTKELSEKSPICKNCTLFLQCSEVKNKKPKLDRNRRRIKWKLKI